MKKRFLGKTLSLTLALCMVVGMTGFSQATGYSYDKIQSFEDLTEAAKAYYEYTDGLTPDVAEDGKSLYGRDSVANYIYVGTKQLGHEMFRVTKDGMVKDIDRDTFKTLWDNYYIPFVNGYFSAYASHRSEDLKTGNVLSFTGSSSGMSYVSNSVTEENDKTHPIEVLVTEPLKFEKGSNIAVQQGAGYCVLKKSEAEQYASVLFLKWFTEADRNLEFAAAAGYSPVKIEANNVDKIKSIYAKQEKVNPNVEQALVMCSNVYTTGETYTNKPFEGSKDVRDVLANKLESVCKADRATVETRIAEGMTREAAVAEFTTDEYFDKWFEDLSNSIDAVVK